IPFLLSLLISQNAAQPPATTTIRGRVVRADGQPIAGARVRVLMVASPSTSMGDATTGEDGRYAITGTWPLPFHVAASTRGDATGSGDSSPATTSLARRSDTSAATMCRITRPHIFQARRIPRKPDASALPRPWTS